MKKRIFILAILCKLLSFSGYAQIVSLHPSVGDTIDFQEKKKYDLLANIPDQNFSYGLFEKDSDSYLFQFYTIENKQEQLKVSSVQFLELKEQINVLDNYFKNKGNSTANLSQSTILHKDYYTNYESLVSKKGLKTIKNEGQLESIVNMMNAPDHIKYQKEDYTRNRLNSHYLNTGAQ